MVLGYYFIVMTVGNVLRRDKMKKSEGKKIVKKLKRELCFIIGAVVGFNIFAVYFNQLSNEECDRD
jgi:hypothetical protein